MPSATAWNMIKATAYRTALLGTFAGTALLVGCSSGPAADSHVKDANYSAGFAMFTTCQEQGVYDALHRDIAIAKAQGVGTLGRTTSETRSVYLGAADRATALGCAGW